MRFAIILKNPLKSFSRFTASKIHLLKATRATAETLFWSDRSDFYDQPDSNLIGLFSEIYVGTAHQNPEMVGSAHPTFLYLLSLTDAPEQQISISSQIPNSNTSKYSQINYHKIPVFQRWFFYLKPE